MKLHRPQHGYKLKSILCVILMSIITIVILWRLVLVPKSKNTNVRVDGSTLNAVPQPSLSGDLSEISPSIEVTPFVSSALPRSSIPPKPPAPITTNKPAETNLASWLRKIRECESGNNYLFNQAPNFGGYYLGLGQWNNFGGPTGYEYPFQAPPSVQDEVALKMIASLGGSYRAFPLCSERIGITNLPPQ